MEQQSQEGNDEINFYEIWQVIMKRKVFIIGLFLIIVFLSAVYSFLSPNIYRGYAILNMMKSDIIITKEIVTPKEIVDLLGKMDIEKRESILPKTYPSLKDVQVRPVKDSNDKIMITVDSKKIDDIPRAISEIRDYLNNTDLVKKNTGRYKEILLKQAAELSELIKASPDLLATYHKLFKAGKLSTIGFNPIEVNKSVIGIKVDLLKIEQDALRLNSGGIEIAMRPYISSKPVSPKILWNLGFAGISSLFLGIFLAFLMEFVGNMKRQRRTQANNTSTR